MEGSRRGASISSISRHRRPGRRCPACCSTRGVGAPRPAPGGPGNAGESDQPPRRTQPACPRLALCSCGREHGARIGHRRVSSRQLTGHTCSRPGGPDGWNRLATAGLDPAWVSVVVGARVRLGCDALSRPIRHGSRRCWDVCPAPRRSSRTWNGAARSAGVTPSAGSRAGGLGHPLHRGARSRAARRLPGRLDQLHRCLPAVVRARHEAEVERAALEGWTRRSPPQKMVF